MELREYILRKAVEADICKEWAEKIPLCQGVDDLMKLYVSGIDFCLEKNFPSNKDLVKLGGCAINEYGVYVDSKNSFTDRPFLVLLGECAAEVAVTEYNVCQLFMKHSSCARVNVQNNGFSTIDCFDNTLTVVTAKDNAKVIINVYGNATVKTFTEGNGVVKVVNKDKLTY